MLLLPDLPDELVELILDRAHDLGTTCARMRRMRRERVDATFYFHRDTSWLGGLCRTYRSVTADCDGCDPETLPSGVTRVNVRDSIVWPDYLVRLSRSNAALTLETLCVHSWCFLSGPLHTRSYETGPFGPNPAGLFPRLRLWVGKGCPPDLRALAPAFAMRCPGT